MKYISERSEGLVLLVRDCAADGSIDNEGP